MKKPENWAKLTWQEKREKRFDWWRAAHGVKFASDEVKAKHDRRLDRYIKAIKLEELPDRVPIDVPAVGSAPAYYAGYDFKTIMYDADKLKESWLKFGRNFDTDTMPMGMIQSGVVNDLMQPRTARWPGGGLPDNATLNQFVEAEYMHEDEYNLYFKNPTDYILRYFLPRTYSVFEPLARLGPLDTFMGVGQQLMMAAGSPEFKKMAETLLKAHEESKKWYAVWAECVRVFREELGYPSGQGAGSQAPFDTIADMLRGTHGSVMDMFRKPDVVLEMEEKILPVTLEASVRMADMSDSPIVFIPMHKGDDMFMSDKQFEKFYWPSFRKLLIGLIEGLVPQPIIDGTYNRRLEYIKDLPKSGVIWVFEKTDMALAKKVLGGHTCISGNVTAAKMYTHTAEDIKKYCRWLLDTCAPGGGYILSLGSGLAGPCDPANIHAIIDTGKEYGWY